jgi:flagellar hook protein FlgE
MGLASALSTAMTGLTAAESTIDVVGNNLANSNTVGFKASTVSFATQFLQTLSLGAQPTASNGGANPRQIGLGTMVADITPNFNQGTVEISSNPYDFAIQGDGFFIVQGSGGQHLYTRNGIFKLNSANELTTMTGNRVLGYGIDDNFQIQRTQLVPMTIPLGQAAVAQATENVYLEGTLTPTGDLAEVAERIQTDILGTAAWTRPETQANGEQSIPPNTTGITNSTIGGGVLPAGTYQYRFVYADQPYDAMNPSTESTVSGNYSVTVGADNRQVQLTSFPSPSALNRYDYIRAYRLDADGSYYYVGEADLSDPAATITDNVDPADLSSANQLNMGVITTEDNIQYRYYATFANAPFGGGGDESRPNPVSEPVTVTNGRIQLTDLPYPSDGNPNGWTHIRIYRCPSTATNDTDFYYIGEVPMTEDATFTDSVADSELGTAEHPKINMNGPAINTSTRVVDLLRRDGTEYKRVFEPGTLQFTGIKGERTLAMKEFKITPTTTVSELIAFMEDALGIQKAPGPDPAHPISKSVEPLPYGAEPGGTVINSRIVFTGNNGVENAIDIGLSGLLLRTNSGMRNIELPFGSIQKAVGESAVTDFLVYDSLGIPLGVRLTTVLESRDSTSTTYRWFADCADNDPATGASISVGTGLVTFDGEGNFIAATETTISIDRVHVSSASPLEFDLDFTKVSGLAASSSEIAVSRQDGSAPGTLTSFIVGEDGVIRGVFSNGVTRDLGQLRLARFSNPNGLEQKGENLYAEGVNSGLAVETDPGQQGSGKVVAGARELSNTDIGGSLIDLILASTMYRGNAKVITTAQEMIDELLALRR